MLIDIEGQNILITGASSGIGRAIAIAVAKEGANVILFARSTNKLEQVAKEIAKQSSKVKVHYQGVDVSSYEQLEKGIKAAVDKVGQIDVLINNAGLALGAPNAFPDLSIADITTMINTNITGFMYATYAVLNSGMKERKRGTILNVTSTTGLEVPPFPGEAVCKTFCFRLLDSTDSRRSFIESLPGGLHKCPSHRTTSHQHQSGGIEARCCRNQFPRTARRL